MLEGVLLLIFGFALLVMTIFAGSALLNRWFNSR